MFTSTTKRFTLTVMTSHHRRRAWTSTDAKTMTIIPRHKKWIRRFGLFGIAYCGLFVADTVANDDVDVVFWNRVRTKLPEGEQNRPRVVILGAGWAALSMIRKLHTDQFQVTIVSPRNYFLFTPLLASTTVGTLHQRSIVEPIRQFVNRNNAQEARFVEAEAVAIDFANNKVQCVDNSAVVGEVSKFDVEYDYLVVATGAESATFGIKGVEDYALFMKEIKHSYAIRDRILDSLETANIPGQPQHEIDRLLHFVVVGGGPSGVEFSAELHDFLKKDITRNYPLTADRVKITLVEAMPHILSMLSPELVKETEKILGNIDIELLLNAQVKEVKEKVLVVQKKGDGKVEEIPFGVLVWVAGNSTRKIIKDAIASLGQKDRRGLVVDEHFRVLAAPKGNVWALGDCAVSKNPPTAQVAYQQGSYLGRAFNNLNMELYGAVTKKISTEELKKIIDESPSFAYTHRGTFAYVGDHKAIAQIPVGDNQVHAHGNATWAAWRGVYFSRLMNYKSRFMVATDWLKTAFFGRDVSRA